MGRKGGLPWSLVVNDAMLGTEGFIWAYTSDPQLRTHTWLEDGLLWVRTLRKTEDYVFPDGSVAETQLLYTAFYGKTILEPFLSFLFVFFLSQVYL